MKTEVIKQQIIDNYNQLSKLANVKPTNKNIIPTWGLSYKNNGTRGFINQLGIMERGRSSIQIVNGNELILKKKPFYLTWKRVLKNMNSLLKNTIENINNSELVTKRVVNIQCFSKEAIERLSKLA